MPIPIHELQAGGHPADSTGAAAPDVFLHVQTGRAGKIKGEAMTTGHTGDIVVWRWRWGVSANTAIGANASTARRSYQHLIVTKGIDSASTGLLNALVKNDPVKDATLTMRKAGGEALDYFTLTLHEARVIGVDIDVGADGWPVEQVVFAFNKIDIEYQPQQSAGLGGGACTFIDAVLGSGSGT